MACKTWYIKYQTKQECLDAEEFERIPVEFGSITTALATTKMSTTRRTSTSATEMTVTTYSNTDLVDSLADLPAVYYEDDFADEAKTFDDKDKTTVAAQVPGDETSVLMRAKVKAGIGFDGKLLTFFFSVEFVGGAMLLILLYKGMEYVADWLNQQRQYDNLERSGVPLHENQAPNPEDTVVPDNRDDYVEGDEGDDDTAEGFTTANLDSTRLDQTQMTRLSQFSPIGRPQLNRTASFNDLSSTSKERRFSKSPSQPITFNLDTDGFDLDASALLRLPTVPTLNQILNNDAASVRDDTAAPSAATDDQPAPSTATATKSAGSSAATPGATTDNPSAITAAEIDDEDSNAASKRRYPDRKRSPPKRYGW